MGILITAFIFFIASIPVIIENIECFLKPREYLKDGTPVYYDRFGRKYINGERIITTYIDGCGYMEFGEKTRKLYKNPVEEKKKRDKQKTIDSLNRSIENNELYYCIYINGKEHTAEVSTGKIIALLDSRKDGTCWKYYAIDGTTDKYDESKGIQITIDEFIGLNYLFGSHKCNDYWFKENPIKFFYGTANK